MKADERQCPHCAEIIKLAATKCKHCAEFIPPPTAKDDQSGPKKKGSGCLVSIGIFLFFLWAAAISSKQPPVKEDPSVAKVRAEQQRITKENEKAAERKLAADRKKIGSYTGNFGDIELYDLKSQWDPDAESILYITGKVRNMTGRDISYMQIEAKCFDSQGQTTEAPWTNMTNVDAGEVRKFKILVNDPDSMKRYAITNIKGR